MISQKNVIRMKLPFPTINSGLAVKVHMYVCLLDAPNYEVVSCQTKKPLLLLPNRPPFHFIDERADIQRNPFKHDTLIACDYAFDLHGLRIDDALLTTTRPDVCTPLFLLIKDQIAFPEFVVKDVNVTELLRLNSKIQLL